MILVDSCVWIDYFRGAITPQTEYLDSTLGVEPVATGDLILMEVLQGFDKDREFRGALKHLTSLTVIELGGVEVAIQAAQHYRTLRALGVTVRKTIDAIIATRCIKDGHTLLHSDQDFEPYVIHLGLRSVF